MRDAIGGVVNLVIIVVFLIIVSGYLAFNVNYTKAFRVKNKIITTYEQYSGNCASGTPCDNIIVQYMQRLGYNVDVDLRGLEKSAKQGNKMSCSHGYCAEEVIVNNNEIPKVYYRITTKIVVDIPIIKNIMTQNNTFNITGNTKTFEKPS